MLNMVTRMQPVKKTESSSQPQESGETETTSKAIMKLLLEQQKMQQEQQWMCQWMLSLLEQKEDKLAQHQREIAEMRV